MLMMPGWDDVPFLLLSATCLILAWAIGRLAWTLARLQNRVDALERRAGRHARMLWPTEAGEDL